MTEQPYTQNLMFSDKKIQFRQLKSGKYGRFLPESWNFVKHSGPTAS